MGGLAFVQFFYFLAIHRLAIGIVLLAEHVVGGRDPVSLLAWGFLFASVFWAVIVPWWSFPVHALTVDASLALLPTPSSLPIRVAMML